MIRFWLRNAFGRGESPTVSARVSRLAAQSLAAVGQRVVEHAVLGGVHVANSLQPCLVCALWTCSPTEKIEPRDHVSARDLIPRVAAAACLMLERDFERANYHGMASLPVFAVPHMNLLPDTVARTATTLHFVNVFYFEPTFG